MGRMGVRAVADGAHIRGACCCCPRHPSTALHFVESAYRITPATPRWYVRVVIRANLGILYTTVLGSQKYIPTFYALLSFY
jgi:hypothetical protein